MSISSEEFHFHVNRAGARLDKYINEVCPAISRTQAQRLIENGQATVNGRVEKPSYQVAIGDVLNVIVPPVTPSRLLPEDIPLSIIYEDSDILVVDKPSGMTVHPAAGHASHTLLNAVLSHLNTVSTETQRPGIVHRLDRDTSGVMVIARHLIAHENLSAQFKKHSVNKVYLTLVRGHLTPREGIIEAPIGRDSSNRKRMTVSAESRGRKAFTRYTVIRYLGNYTLLEVMPQTGRTHQIRVHLAAIGYPVVGDATYGIKSPILVRQFLHAHRLGFYHPSTGNYVEFTSPLPDDLEKTLREIH